MDQRVTEGVELSDTQLEQQVESAPPVTTEVSTTNGEEVYEAEYQLIDGNGVAAVADGMNLVNVDASSDVDQALTSMEALALALSIDVESVFEFTEKLEELLRPSTARTDHSDDDDHAAAELRMKNNNSKQNE